MCGPFIKADCGISHHCYTDDIQLHFSFKADDLQSLSSLLQSLAAIEGWMAANLLQLNTTKTEVLIIASDSLWARIKEHVGPLKNNTHTNIRNLGVQFDQTMQLESHVKSLCRNCFFHLRNIAKLRSIVSHSELEMSIHAFISSRLDYCNSLFTRLNQSSVHRLQLVQNAAARLLTRSKKSRHITAILATLHWLPIHFTIQYKVLLLTYKAVHGQAPTYIQELIHRHNPRRALRSTDPALLSVPRTRLKTKGDTSFEAMAPRLWNTLPLNLRLTLSIDSFKRQLKTHLYKLAFNC